MDVVAFIFALFGIAVAGKAERDAAALRKELAKLRSELREGKPISDPPEPPAAS
ncbi:hypothetical protein [Tuwongella immobilis]|uniref:Uncharacterized protein n=1 Tax=Tuwongella immobilis TaxID=692036 RepID=A0A6C2YMD4_9BACT|nr:hypothetical protein [Tuwongella immobilis]VIP02517.1 unnamed protein product [Tuwongella immobilis]VTS01640.1 unnamed protein product [Tuwongella immobilis]